MRSDGACTARQQRHGAAACRRAGARDGQSAAGAVASTCIPEYSVWTRGRQRRRIPRTTCGLPHTPGGWAGQPVPTPAGGAVCVCVWRAHACMYYAASRRRRGDHSACGATNRHRRLGLAILLLLALPLSLMLLLLRGLPPSYHLRGFRSLTTHPEPIALGFGYSTGEHCHADPPLLPPESRPSGCTAPAYAHQLMRAANGLTASVIIIAHNEAGCALRRTLLAVMSPSRATALAEVIVVDDSSSPSASEALAAAGGIQGTVRVRYLRSEERLGVVRARTSRRDVRPLPSSPSWTRTASRRWAGSHRSSRSSRSLLRLSRCP